MSEPNEPLDPEEGVTPEGVITDNDFAFGSNGITLAPLIPVRIETKQQAYRAGIWIKLMGEFLPDEPVASTWEEIQNAIEGT